MFLVYAGHSGNLTWRPHHGLLLLGGLHTFWHYPANGANSDWNVLNIVGLCCWSVILETSSFLRKEIETFTQMIVLSCAFVYLNVFFYGRLRRAGRLPSAPCVCPTTLQSIPSGAIMQIWVLPLAAWGIMVVINIIMNYGFNMVQEKVPGDIRNECVHSSHSF